MRPGAPLSRRLAVAGIASLAGCSILQKPSYIERTQWPLTLSRPESLPPPRHGKVLQVQDIIAAPGLDQQGVQWRLPNGSIHVDFYNLWIVSPALAVTDNLRRWLAGSGLFAAVVGTGSGLTADLALQGELTTFIADPQQRQGHAALSLMLLDLRRTPPRVLMQRTVSGTGHMPTDTPAGVVAAERDAVLEVLRRTEIALTPFAARQRGG